MIDTAIVTILQSLRNPFFDFLALILAFLFSTEVMLIFSLIVITIAFLKKKTPALVLSGAILANTVVVAALKFIIKRQRTGMILDLPMLPYSKYSFPSGHTAMAFLLATILAKEHPKYTIYLFAIAIATGISRLYLGLHYLSDVVAGAIIGILIGAIFNFYSGQIKKLGEKIIKQINSF
ncbi:MAG: phosphatase PAP2 family protein [Nanoarchaeota archaeon]|nr:phosphatase PAP2 family protein [Nanoarchaeota archaeon]